MIIIILLAYRITFTYYYINYNTRKNIRHYYIVCTLNIMFWRGTNRTDISKVTYIMPIIKL